MKKIFLIIFSIALFTGLQAEISDPEGVAQQAEKHFKAQAFGEAMSAYESLYAEGYYAEVMLYRMAYMKEQLQEYPQAIYFLKKAAKEYGNPAIDAKVKHLMQLQGSERFYPSSSWNAYLKFFRSWGWLIWGLFALSVAVVLAHLFVQRWKDATWRRGVATGAWTLAVLLGGVLAHRSFFVPDLGVLTGPTAFYSEPAYSSVALPKVFSPGETVSVLDAHDIWLQVQAGDKVVWVPHWTVTML